jgi:hypothetical protein
MLIFGLNLCSYSYFFSFMFQRASSAYKYFPWINIFLLYILPWGFYIRFNNIDEVRFMMLVISPFINLYYSFAAASYPYVSPEFVNLIFYFMTNNNNVKITSEQVLFTASYCTPVYIPTI